MGTLHTFIERAREATKEERGKICDIKTKEAISKKKEELWYKRTTRNSLILLYAFLLVFFIDPILCLLGPVLILINYVVCSRAVDRATWERIENRPKNESAISSLEGTLYEKIDKVLKDSPDMVIFLADLKNKVLNDALERHELDNYWLKDKDHVYRQRKEITDEIESFFETAKSFVKTDNSWEGVWVINKFKFDFWWKSYSFTYDIKLKK